MQPKSQVGRRTWRPDALPLRGTAAGNQDRDAGRPTGSGSSGIQTQAEQQGPPSLVCFRCQAEGHIALNCTAKRLYRGRALPGGSLLGVQSHAHEDLPEDGQAHAHQHTCEGCGTVFAHRHVKHSEEESKRIQPEHLCVSCRRNGKPTKQDEVIPTGEKAESQEIDEDDIKRRLYSYLAMRSVGKERDVDFQSNLSFMGISWLRTNKVESEVEQQRYLARVIPLLMLPTPTEEATISAGESWMWRFNLWRAQDYSTGKFFTIGLLTFLIAVAAATIGGGLAGATYYGVMEGYYCPPKTVWRDIYEWIHDLFTDLIQGPVIDAVEFIWPLMSYAGLWEFETKLDRLRLWVGRHWTFRAENLIRRQQLQMHSFVVFAIVFVFIFFRVFKKLAWVSFKRG